MNGGACIIKNQAHQFLKLCLNEQSALASECCACAIRASRPGICMNKPILGAHTASSNWRVPCARPDNWQTPTLSISWMQAWIQQHMNAAATLGQGGKPLVIGEVGSQCEYSQKSSPDRISSAFYNCLQIATQCLCSAVSATVSAGMYPTTKHWIQAIALHSRLSPLISCALHVVRVADTVCWCGAVRHEVHPCECFLPVIIPQSLHDRSLPGRHLAQG